MGLLDDLRTGTSPRPHKPCKMALALKEMDDETAAEAVKIMQSIADLEGVYSSTWFARQLLNNGFVVNHATILRHARKQCGCAH